MGRICYLVPPADVPPNRGQTAPDPFDWVAPNTLAMVGRAFNVLAAAIPTGSDQVRTRPMILCAGGAVKVPAGSQHLITREGPRQAVPRAFGLHGTATFLFAPF
jgi:hypothetical protein